MIISVSTIVLVSVSIESPVNKSKFCLQIRVIQIQTIAYKHMHYQIGHTQGKQPSTIFRLIWHDHLHALGKQITIFIVQLTAHTYQDNPIYRCRTFCIEQQYSKLWLWRTYRQYPHIANRSISCGTTHLNRRWGWDSQTSKTDITYDNCDLLSCLYQT